MMLRRCAWCGQLLEQPSGMTETGVTHGICISCRHRLSEERPPASSCWHCMPGFTMVLPLAEQANCHTSTGNIPE